MQLPLKLKVLKLDHVPVDGGTKPPCVECFYSVVDAAGDTIVPRNHFVCKAKEFNEVASYTLDRLTSQLKATVGIEAAPEAQALLAKLIAESETPPAPPEPTPNDQVISPPGAVRSAKVK